MTGDNDWRGMRMDDVRVGMRMRSTLIDAGNDITVTAITPRGFAYVYDTPWCIHPLIGSVIEGEHFGQDGWATYVAINPPV